MGGPSRTRKLTFLVWGHPSGNKKNRFFGLGAPFSNQRNRFSGLGVASQTRKLIFLVWRAGSKRCPWGYPTTRGGPDWSFYLLSGLLRCGLCGSNPCSALRGQMVTAPSADKRLQLGLWDLRTRLLRTTQWRDHMSVNRYFENHDKKINSETPGLPQSLQNLAAEGAASREHNTCFEFGRPQIVFASHLHPISVAPDSKSNAVTYLKCWDQHCLYYMNELHSFTWMDTIHGTNQKLQRRGP